jgi:5-methyltetrahydropteroyltriglutamate--homocysteine methyltransferase
MMRSTDRFLTTHAGSLPRPDDLVRIMYAKEEGQAVERAALASHVRNAVAGVVARQKGAGVDIINDGEMSKPSYATYVKDRLSGFGRDRQHVRLSGLGGLPKPGKARLWRSGAIQAEDSGLQRADRIPRY